MKTTLYKTNTDITYIITSLVLLLMFSNFAKANIGSINIHYVDHESIQVSRTLNTVHFQATGGNDNKICWKKAGTFGTICGANQITTSANNYTITGLLPDTTYKIKLKCHCRKKIFNNFKFPKWRNVAVITVTTGNVPTPSAPQSHLAVYDITNHSAMVKLTHDDMLDFTWARVCFRKKWQINLNFFDNACRNLSIVGNIWGTPISINGGNYIIGEGGAVSGEINIAPFWVDANNSVEIPINNPDDDTLEACTKYKIMGVLRDDQFNWSTDVGSLTQIETSGPCPGLFTFFKMSETVVNDYEEIFDNYVRSIDKYYKKPLFEVLVAFDESLYDLRELFIREEQEDISQTSILLTYLIETEAYLYDKWQNSRAIRGNRLTLENYIEDNHPILFRELTRELQQ